MGTLMDDRPIPEYHPPWKLFAGGYNKIAKEKNS